MSVLEDVNIESEVKVEKALSSYLLRMNLVSLFLEHRVVDAQNASDGGTGKDTLVTAVYGGVDARDGGLVDPTAKGKALVVNNVRNQGLGNAEGQWVDDGVIRVRATTHATVMGADREVDEVAGKARQDCTGESPEQCG